MGDAHAAYIEILAALVARLALVDRNNTALIWWGAPVPAFGDPLTSRVATLGLNPSNIEFVDGKLQAEIIGSRRRFQTLRSLGLEKWDECDGARLVSIEDSCQNYFRRNPYDRWFKPIDRVLRGVGASYYGEEPLACHLDVVPFATFQKWNDLTLNQKEHLIDFSGTTLGLILQASAIRVLVLNGMAVVNYVRRLIDVELESTIVSRLDLKRRNDEHVKGVTFRGLAKSIGGVSLQAPLIVLGYNHNVQSSLGVSHDLRDAISAWLGEEVASLRVG